MPGQTHDSANATQDPPHPRGAHWPWLLAPLCGLLWVALVLSIVCGAPRDVTPLPAYSLEADAATQPWGRRGASPVEVRQDGILGIVVRPMRRVIGPLDLRVFRLDGAGAQRVTPPSERLADGTFLLRATPRDLRLAPGRGGLSLVVGRPWALPANPQAMPQGTGGTHWQRLDMEVFVLSE